MYLHNFSKYNTNHKKLRMFIDEYKKQLHVGNLLPGYDTIIDSSRNIYHRLLWITIICLCLVFFIFQVYNRISFYLTEPIAVRILHKKDTNSMVPTVKLYNLDTDALKSFWNTTTDELSKVQCFNPLQRIMETSTSFNFSELWSASNITKNLQAVKIITKEKINESVTLNDGKIIRSSSDSSIKLLQSNELLGHGIIISLDKKISLESQVLIILAAKGLCGESSNAWFILDDLMFFRYSYVTYMGTIANYKYSVKEYNYVNRLKTPCEQNYKIVINCYKDCLALKHSGFICKLPSMQMNENLIDCDKINNISLVRMLYRKSLNILYYTIGTVHCGCIRPCKQTFFIGHGSVHLNKNKKEIRFLLTPSDHLSITTVEEFTYNIVHLFTDIGGNLGLYLGFSVLSLTDLTYVLLKQIYTMQPSHKKFSNFHRIHNIFQKQLHLEIEIKQATTFPSFYNKVKTGIIGFLIFFSFILIYYSTLYYCSTPTRIITEIKEMSTIFIPNLIFCGESFYVSRLKRKLEKMTGISKCKWHFLDLIDRQNITVEALWSKQQPEFLENIIDLFIQMTRSSIQVKNYTLSILPFLNGNCIEFSFAPMLYAGMLSSYVLSFSSNNFDCSDGKLDMYLKPPNHSVFSLIFSNQLVPTKLTAVLQMEIFSFQRYNSSNKKCINEIEFYRCFANCYKNRVAHLIKCRLPFMDNITKYTCNTTKSATKSHIDFLQLVLKNPNKDCNCLIPCTETGYKIDISMNNANNFPINFVVVLPLTNHIENIIELLSYDFIALLCDIANSFALILGISLLAVFDIFFNNMRKMKKC